MAKSIIDLHTVWHSYPLGNVSLEDVNLSLPKGKRIALLGGNGAGKSTLMLLLNGIFKPTQGVLYFNGQRFRYNKRALRELRSRVGFVFQEPDDQLIAPTVFEELSFGLYNLNRDKQWVREKTEKAIDEFCLHHLSDKPPHNLSTGQKKRICLASVLAMEPEVLVCDEPASSLDPWHANLTFNLLNRLHQQGKTVLISTHDVNQAYTWADHIVLMNEGRVIMTGTPKEVFSKQAVIEEAGLHLPFIVETCYALMPDLDCQKLPSNMEEFKKFLNVSPCMDS
jgi:cobalt/nickel transport system ATP-binding protein